MKKEKVIEWFCDKFNSCYPVKHSNYPESVFMYYDTQFVRKIKLAKISGQSITFPKEVKGSCLFELDWKNKSFYYNYDEIYQFLEKNYNSNHQDINKFIKDRLNEADKMSVFWALVRMPLTPRRLRWFLNLKSGCG